MSLDGFNPDFGEPGGPVKLSPTGGVTEVEAMLGPGKIRRGPRMQAAHEANTTTAQNPTYLREQRYWLGPEMYYDREDAIEAVFGEWKALR